MTPVIVESLANVPVESLKVKMFLSLSKETTVAVTTVESEARPVTVSVVEKSPDLSNTKTFFLNVKVGGLGDNWCSAPDSTIFKLCTLPISVPYVKIEAPDPFVSSTVTIGKDW